MNAADRIEIVIVDDEAELAREGAARISAVLTDAARHAESASVALAGGSTPRELYRQLAALRDLPWPQLHLFWSDERCVPPDHPESNYRMARETLLSGAPVAADRVHRIHGEEAPAAAAESYDATLRQVLADGGRLDLVLLGMGEDGHVASLFPEHAVLEEKSRWAAPVTGPGIEPPRVTLTLPALNAAKQVMIVVAGPWKTKALRSVLGNAASPLPAARVCPSEKLTWLLDRAAATGEL